MKNFLLSILTIFVLVSFFFGLLNFFLSGVPLFNLFKINMSQALYVTKDESLKKNYEISFDKDEEYRAHKCGPGENGFYNMSYVPDDFGFRDNKKELFYDTDVIIIGDSFGISSCVNFPYDLTTRLKKKIKNDRVLNISVGGTGPYHQKGTLKCLVEKNKTNFNTFIWLFYEGNDHEDLDQLYNKKFKCPNIYERYINNGKIKVDYKPNQNILILKIKLFLSNYTRGFGTLTKYFKKYPKLIPNDIYYTSIVEDLNNFLISKNVKKKIIFYIPKYTRLAHKKISHPQIDQLNDVKNLVESTARKYDFEFIDGSEIFHNQKDPLDVFHYRLPTHFNIRGYDMIAEVLSKNFN